jgi:hypothetical protein
MNGDGRAGPRYPWSPGLLTIVFIAAFGAMSGHSPGGLFERLAGGDNTLLLLGPPLARIVRGRARIAVRSTRMELLWTRGR